MNNCIKSISKIYLIMLMSVVSFLVTSNIFIFAAENEQQQTVTITSDSKDSSFFPFFEQIKNKTESAAILPSPNVSEKVTETPIINKQNHVLSQDIQVL